MIVLMRPLPTWPPLAAFAIVLLAAILAMAIDHAQFAGWYAAWKDNQTFIAAMIALGAAVWAARPAYRQMQLQSAQAAVALLEIVERDAVKVSSEVNMLLGLWSTVNDLKEAIIAYNDEKWDANLLYAIDMVSKIDLAQVDQLLARTDLSLARRESVLHLRTAVSLLVAKNEIALEASPSGEGILTRKAVSDLSALVMNDLIGLATQLHEMTEILSAEMRDLHTRSQRLRRSTAVIYH